MKLTKELSQQEKIYYEEYKKAAQAAWNLAEYLIENPQDFLSEPWLLLPSMVRETVEYIVNRKKVVDAGSIKILPFNELNKTLEKIVNLRTLRDYKTYKETKPESND